MSGKIVNYRIGRLALHTLCALRDHKWAWHWLGMKREFAWSNTFLEKRSQRALAFLLGLLVLAAPVAQP